MMAKAPKENKTIITMESQSVHARLNREPNLREYKKAMIEHFRTLGGNADLDADGKEVTLAEWMLMMNVTTVARRVIMPRIVPNPRKEEARSGTRETMVARTAGALRMEDSTLLASVTNVARQDTRQTNAGRRKRVHVCIRKDTSPKDLEMSKQMQLWIAWSACLLHWNYPTLTS
jgi:hypothetical protein